MVCRTRGFSLIDMLVTIAILGIISMLVVPQLMQALDRGRQRRSMGDMRNVSTALSSYQIDNSGLYPTTGQGLNALLPDYYASVPEDGWGNSYRYYGIIGGCTYYLIGLGANGAWGPNPPDPWTGDEFDPDIWQVNGTFLRAPRDAGFDLTADQHHYQRLLLKEAEPCIVEHPAPPWPWLSPSWRSRLAVPASSAA